MRLPSIFFPQWPLRRKRRNLKSHPSGIKTSHRPGDKKKHPAVIPALSTKAHEKRTKPTDNFLVTVG
jgi:hypothetical protein